jgi:hypothetical protein
LVGMCGGKLGWLKPIRHKRGLLVGSEMLALAVTPQSICASKMKPLKGM